MGFAICSRLSLATYVQTEGLIAVPWPGAELRAECIDEHVEPLSCIKSVLFDKAAV